MTPWARNFLVTTAVFAVLLMVTICAWGTSHLLLCTAVAAGGVLVVLCARLCIKARRVWKQMNADLISSPFRLPAQDRTDYPSS